MTPTPGTYFNPAGDTRKVISTREAMSYDHAGAKYTAIRWIDARGRTFEGSMVEWKRWAERKPVAR